MPLARTIEETQLLFDSKSPDFTVLVGRALLLAFAYSSNNKRKHNMKIFKLNVARFAWPHPQLVGFLLSYLAGSETLPPAEPINYYNYRPSRRMQCFGQFFQASINADQGRV